MRAILTMPRHSQLVASLLLLCFPLFAQQKPPSGKELDQLIHTYLLADDRTEAGHGERTAIQERLAALPPLDRSQTAAWQGKLQKLWAKGRTLATSDDNWFWAEDKPKNLPARGRYLIGGETKKPIGLAIELHGGTAADAVPDAGAFSPAFAKLGFAMVAPQTLEATGRGWTDPNNEQFVLDLLDAALRTWKIDSDKVFLVGHSMGGFGTWVLGAHHADRMAALAPSSGTPTPIYSAQGGPIVDMQEGVFPSLRNVYLSIYQSRDDQVVPPDANRYAVQRLLAAQKQWGGFEHDYWEVDGRGHRDPPGGYIVQLEKIAARTRSAIPTRIVWQPDLAWKRQFYWLYWQAPVAKATLVADLDRAHNAVAITCDQPTEGLYVLLDSRNCDLQKEVTVTVNGSETFRGKAAPDLGTLLMTSTQPDAKLQFVARVPAFAVKPG